MVTNSPQKTIRKYAELEAQWRRSIMLGEWQPGDRLPTFAELRASSDVSRTTVERVCRSLEQDGLIIRRQGSGIYVAPTRPRRRTGLIGFSGYGFIEKPRPRYWSELQAGIEEAVTNAGYGIVLLDYAAFREWETLEGLLLAEVFGEPAYRVMASLAGTLPAVSLLCEVKEWASVVANDYQGGQLATEHLLSLGHRRIACLMDDFHPLPARRLEGYRAALRKAGITPDPNWVRPYGDTSFTKKYADFPQRAEEVMSLWLAEDWKASGCTAVIAMNDWTALGIIQACRNAGLRVPEDVSVIGYDNIEVCDYVSPSLTSIEVPVRTVGSRAAELLFRRIERQTHEPETIMLPVKLIVRESTAKAPAQ